MQKESFHASLSRHRGKRLPSIVSLLIAALGTVACDSEPADTDNDTGTDEDAGAPDAGGTDTAGDTDTLVSLGEKYQDHFLIGAAIDGLSYQDAHVPLLQKHFNATVCENDMKWENLQKVEGAFNFAPVDKMMDFAEANHMPVRGHTLIWHKQTPTWVFRGEAGETVTKEVLLERLRSHITAVMTHYKGRVYAWDVVNEAIIGYTESGEDAGESVSQVVRWGYRNSQWYEICGEDYIMEAFRAARAADPDAKLFYNDFWNYLDGKRAAIIAMIQKLQAENLIDGVGLQCHLNIDVAQEKLGSQSTYQTPENLEREIQEYAALGLDVHITELDLSIYTRDYSSDDTSKWYTDDLLNDDYQERQAARYKAFFDMFRRNSHLLSNVTFWGIADDNTWLSELASGRPDHPLLFDKYLNPKRAFFAVTEF